MVKQKPEKTNALKLSTAPRPDPPEFFRCAIACVCADRQAQQTAGGRDIQGIPSRRLVGFSARKIWLAPDAFHKVKSDGVFSRIVVLEFPELWFRLFQISGGPGRFVMFATPHEKLGPK